MNFMKGSLFHRSTEPEEVEIIEESGGGVTLSGGEVMAQDMDYVVELAKRLHSKGYSVYIDTCGFAP